MQLTQVLDPTTTSRPCKRSMPAATAEKWILMSHFIELDDLQLKICMQAIQALNPDNSS